MITYLPYLLLKAFPDQWTIEELLLKIPVWVAGLVCIPIVLIGRLYGNCGVFRCMSCRGGSQLLQPYFSGLLRHGHVFDYRPRFRFLFLVGRIKERIGRLSRCGRSILYLSRFFTVRPKPLPAPCAWSSCFIALEFPFWTLVFSFAQAFRRRQTNLSLSKSNQSPPSTSSLCFLRFPPFVLLALA